jgi:hypothetical protein
LPLLDLFGNNPKKDIFIIYKKRPRRPIILKTPPIYIKIDFDANFNFRRFSQKVERWRFGAFVKFFIVKLQ